VGHVGPAAPANMNDVYSFVAVTTYERIGANLVRGDSTLPAVAGIVSSGGNTMITSSTLRVTKRTALVGRAFRGRMYAPYTLGEVGVSATGAIIGTNVTLFQTAYTALMFNLANGTPSLLPVLLHTNPAITPTNISSLFIQPVVGTQRRRLQRA